MRPKDQSATGSALLGTQPCRGSMEQQRGGSGQFRDLWWTLLRVACDRALGKKLLLLVGRAETEPGHPATPVAAVENAGCVLGELAPETVDNTQIP